MEHLTIHLATEVRIAGPVHYRSMWAVERFLGNLKSMVHTLSHPEGSIAEGYLLDETLTFCSRYLQGCTTKFTQTRHHNDCIGPNDSTNHQPYLRIVGHPLFGPCVEELDYTSWIQAQRYVLVNYPHIAPYVQQHHNILSAGQRKRIRDVERAHHNTFHTWFADHVQSLISNNVKIPEEEKVLAQKPYRMVRKYNAYSINGCTFHARGYGDGKNTQCDGVSMIAKTSSFSSANDKNPALGDVAYYGRITEIVELNYSNKGNVVLFKCDWVDSVRPDVGVRKDKYGITEVNFNHLLSSGSDICDEPFILATQATQVYYVQDSIEKDWYAVVHPPTRDFFDMEARIDGEY